MEYTVKALADLAGVTPRTLRWYDQTGLLKPLRTTEAGYRLYGPKQLDRLQDILFYRAGEFCTLGVERMLYITENMQSFGLRLEDGTIITTDEAYVPLLMSGYYYSIRPIFSNQF
mgnify:CR=1 FL=1